MQLAALTQGQAAALLSVTPRALRDWHDAPRNKDGSYPGPALVAYYVAKITGGGDFDDQRQRLAAAQAEKVEHENAIRRGQLADVADVARYWAEFVGNCRMRILGMGSKLGPQLVNIGDAALIATAIRSEGRAALAELAEYEPVVGGRAGDDPAGSATDGATAGADGKRVGRPGKAALERKQRRTGPVED